MFPGFTFLIPEVFSPKTAFRSLSKPLVNCRQTVCPCYHFHRRALIPAASNAGMTEVHRHCVRASRASPADHRALSGNLPTSWQIWTHIDLYRVQTSVWAKKTMWFWQYTKVYLNLDFMQTYFETVWKIKREVCLLLQLRLYLCKYELWFT